MYAEGTDQREYKYKYVGMFEGVRYDETCISFYFTRW